MIKKLFILFSLTSCLNLSFAQIDRVVLVVNNDAVTEYDVERYKKNLLFLVPEKEREKASAQLEQNLMALLQDYTLMLQYAKKANIEPTAEQVNQFNKLNLKKANIDPEKLNQKLNEFGISPEDFNQYVKNTIAIYLLKSQVVASQVQLTPQKVKRYRYQRQFDESLFTFNDYLIPFDTKNAHAKAEQLQKGVEKNLRIPEQVKSFYKKTVFEDAKHDNIPDAFLTAFKNQQPPIVSKVIQADNGYHVLWLKSVKAPPLMDEKQAMSTLYEEQSEKILKKWLTEVKEASYSHVFE